MLRLCSEKFPFIQEIDCNPRQFARTFDVRYQRFLDTNTQRFSAYFPTNSAKFNNHTNDQSQLHIYESVSEAIGSECYRLLGDGSFMVPPVGIYEYPLCSKFIRSSPSAVNISSMFENGVVPWILSPVEEGWKQLGSGLVNMDGNQTKILDFILETKNIPRRLIAPSGHEVPILGLMELIAVGHKLGDANILGPTLNNVGFIWEKDIDNSIVAARIVKTQFCGIFRINNDNRSDDRGFCTINKSDYSQGWLADFKNIQIAWTSDDLWIEWDKLACDHKAIFLKIFFQNTLDDNDLLTCFNTDFNCRSLNIIPTKKYPHFLPPDLIHEMLSGLKYWWNLRKEQFSEPLQTLHQHRIKSAAK